MDVSYNELYIYIWFFIKKSSHIEHIDDFPRKQRGPAFQVGLSIDSFEKRKTANE